MTDLDEAEARGWPNLNLAGVKKAHGRGTDGRPIEAGGEAWCKCQLPAGECAPYVALERVRDLEDPGRAGRAEQVMAQVLDTIRIFGNDWMACDHAPTGEAGLRCYSCGGCYLQAMVDGMEDTLARGGGDFIAETIEEDGEQ
ncbi:MAG: hypothetical protein ACYCZN_01475 [Candidatus Dormibacteria bacterium]